MFPAAMSLAVGRCHFAVVSCTKLSLRFFLDPWRFCQDRMIPRLHGCCATQSGGPDVLCRVCYEFFSCRVALHGCLSLCRGLCLRRHVAGFRRVRRRRRRLNLRLRRRGRDVACSRRVSSPGTASTNLSRELWFPIYSLSFLSWKSSWSRKAPTSAVSRGDSGIISPGVGWAFSTDDGPLR